MLLIALALLVFAMTLLAADGAPTRTFVYPRAKTVDQVDDYHGTKVADPYRWLEDTDSAETHAWVEAENKVTFGYLEQIPYRHAIKDRLTKLWNYERYGVPEKEGERYFYQHNNGLQNQNVLWSLTSLTRSPACCSIRIRFPPTARSRWSGTPLATTANCSLTACPPRVPTGRSGTCAMSIPARIFPTFEVGEVFRSVLDARRQRIFLQPLRRAEAGHACCTTPTTFRSFTTTGSARRSRKTR